MPRRLHWIALFLMGMLVMASHLALTATPVQAQAEEGAEPAAADAPAPAGEAPHVVHQESKFWWFIKSSGVIGLCIFLLSIYFVSIIIQLFVQMRAVVAMPPEELAMADQFLQNRDYQGLFDFTSKSNSLYCRLVSSGIAELPAGLAEAREVMDRVADVEGVDMERKISMLAVMGTLGPMIGLVGTLKGMIASFAVIATSDAQMKASDVAGGISEALLLTFEGVALSIPAIFFYSYFKNRITKLGVETLLSADEFIRRLVQQAKQRPAAPAQGHAMARS